MVHSQTQQIVFTGSVLSGYFLSGVVYILLPIAAYLLMMHRKAARFYPVVTGVIVYFICRTLQRTFCKPFRCFSRLYEQDGDSSRDNLLP